MKTLIQNHLQQTQLNQQLQEAVYNWDIPLMTKLLEKGANPNQKFKYGLIAHIVQSWSGEFQMNGLLLLLNYGANVNIRSSEGMLPIFISLLNKKDEITSLLQEHGAVQMDQLDLNPKEVAQSCRFGNTSPEVISDPYFHHMFQTGKSAFEARTSTPINPPQLEKKYEKDYEEIMNQVHFGKLDATTGAGYLNFLISGRAPWCFNRYGYSRTILSDGSMILIGGAHEDFYDEDFWIYNDVIHIDSAGKVTIYFYPKTVFPSTDFHSANLVENSIYIIGNIGYQKDRQVNRTPIYLLDLSDFSVKKITDKGRFPGWIAKHSCIYDDHAHQLYVFGGEIWNGKSFVENEEIYTMDLGNKKWK